MEKEWKWIRNISLIQNIMVSLFYVGLIVTYLLFDAVVKGLFEHIDVQRRGEIDDVTGWGIIFEGIGGFFGALVVVLLLIAVIAATVYLIVMWLMFRMMNRRSRPLRKRRRWGIADQCCKILIGVFCLKGVFDKIGDLFYMEDIAGGDIVGVGRQLMIALFFLISSIYLLIKIWKCKDEESKLCQKS